MRSGQQHATRTLLAIAIGIAVALVGCSKTSDNPVGAAFGSAGQVQFAMAFNKASSGLSLLKTSGVESADSLRIDSILVVVDRIHLRSASDSDDTGGMGWHHGRGWGEIGHMKGFNGEDDSENVTLNGPFVVHIRDTLAVDFASQRIPPGTYNDISFVIHRLSSGDRCFDSDRHRQVVINPTDSSAIGSSIVIWGAALKNGTWTPFAFHADLELTVNLPGTFTVPQAISSVTLAFNFNVSLLFKDPATGTYLDPTDTSFGNHQRIVQAIRNAFGQGRCGNGRGH